MHHKLSWSGQGSNPVSVLRPATAPRHCGRVSPKLHVQSVPGSKHSLSVIKTSQLMLYREIIAVCSQNHTKHTNTLCGQNVELYIKTQSVPRSKHSLSVIKTSQLMLYREIIAVCSQIHTKHINTLCGQNVELCIKTQSVPRSKHTPSRL